MLLALALGVLLRILLLTLTPVAGPSLPGQLSSYNDELAHGNYVRHLLLSGALPVHVEAIDANAALERGEYENYQPPLYYLLTAGLCSLCGASDLQSVIITGRAVNAVLSIGLVALFLRIGRALAWSARNTASGVIFIALSGVFVRFTTTAGNEALFWLLAGGMIFTAIRLSQRPDMRRYGLLFVLLATLGLYTKLTALLLLPLPLFALWRSWRSPRVIFALAAAYVLIFAATLPVWLRNIHEFGALLPLSAGFGVPAWRIPGATSAAFALRSFIFPWWEFWRGALGLLFMAPAVLVFTHSAFRRGGARLLLQVPVLAGALAIAFASFLWLNLRYDQAEARYLYSAWPALCVVFGGDGGAIRRLWLLVVVLMLPFIMMLLPAGG